MRRLYLHIYLTLLGSLAALTLLFWVTRNLFEGSHEPPWGEFTAAILTAALPQGQGAEAGTDAVLRRYAAAARMPLSLYAEDGRLLASTEKVVPLPAYRSRSHWIGYRTVALRLEDGRWLVAEPVRGNGWHLLAALFALGLLIAAASYPAVRHLTRRLERLRERVEALGSGDLNIRVPVEGRDEIAALARSFNGSVEQIARLLQAQRDLLANASHELRSPLTRIGLAFELLAGDGRQDLREQVQRDIAELDELIGELLLASRLQAVADLPQRDDVDLLALATAEADQVKASVSGEAVHVQGDAKLLRRLLRNLLENARRYGGEGQISVRLARQPDATVVMYVEDGGPGIPEAERERVFEPFYRRTGTTETGHGVGLGLALVRQIARRHGGDVRCLPRQGAGSCFAVTLPVPAPWLS